MDLGPGGTQEGRENNNNYHLAYCLVKQMPMLFGQWTMFGHRNYTPSFVPSENAGIECLCFHWIASTHCLPNQIRR